MRRVRTGDQPANLPTLKPTPGAAAFVEWLLESRLTVVVAEAWLGVVPLYMTNVGVRAAPALP